MPCRNKDIEFVSDYVLVSDGKCVGLGHYDFDDRQWVYNMPGMIEATDNDITHWKPLPASPKSENSEAVEQPLTNVKTPAEEPTPSGEICPFCGGDPIKRDGINKYCEYCDRWW